jgi:hypothetical protein
MSEVLTNYTHLVLIELGEMQTNIGKLLQCEDTAMRGGIRVGLERAAAHIVGENYTPIEEKERRLRLRAREVLSLTERLLQELPPDYHSETWAKLARIASEFGPDKAGA